MKTKWGLLLFLFLVFSVRAADSILLQQGTPVFREADMKQKPLLIVEKPTPCDVLQKKTVLYEKTPLMKRVPFVQFTIPGQGNFWAAPNVFLQVDPETRRYSYEFEKNPLLMFFGALCILGALLGTVYCFRKKCSDPIAIAAITLFCWGVLLYLIGASGNVLSRPVDEFSYFAVAKGLSSLNFSGQWLYTVGLPLFYLPFLLCLGASGLYDILDPFLIFSGFFLMPSACITGYLAFRKLSGSKRAFSAILLCLACFLIYRHSYILKDSGTFVKECLVKSYPAFPSAEISFPLFELYTLFGYNALSDTLSLALILGGIAFLLYRGNSLGSLAWFSALYGLACLVRINNILYAPLMLLLLYFRDADLLHGFRAWGRRLLTGAITFLAVFSIQFAVNQIQFGGILRFPYALHGNQAGAGFLFSMVPHGIAFLCTANHVWFVLGTLALFLISERKTRTILAFWIFPVVFFFFGYPVVFNNATRFILPVYFALAAAVALCDIWKEHRSVRFRILAILLPAILFTAPAGSPEITRLHPWRWDLSGMTNETARNLQIGILILSFLILLSFLWDWKKNTMEKQMLRQVILFLAGFLILFYWANPFATALVMLCAMFRALYDAGILIRTARAECESAGSKST